MFGSNLNKAHSKANNEMKSLVKEARQLIRETSKSPGDKADELRSKGMKLLDASISRAQDLQSTVRDNGRELIENGRDMIKNTDDYVHDSPWRALAISGAVSAGIGLLVGLSVSRKD